MCQLPSSNQFQNKLNRVWFNLFVKHLAVPFPRSLPPSTVQSLAAHEIDMGAAVNLFKRFASTLRLPEMSVPVIHTRVRDMVSAGLFDQTLVFYKEELHPASLHACPLVLPSVFKACSSSLYSYFGLQLHCIAIKSGSDFDLVISNALLSMYAKCSQTEFARRVFDTMPERDTISWNSMVNCYIQNGYCMEALKTFKKMFSSGFFPKPELIAGVMSLSARLGDPRVGRLIHALAIVDEEIEESVFLLTSLVDMYFKFGDSWTALHIFYQMEVKNEVSWTAVISGCTANSDYEMAMDYFREMQLYGIKPNRVTSVAILSACAELGCIKHGKEIHGYAIRHGFGLDPHLSASLIHIYCKSGEVLRSAKLIFERSRAKDVVLWSSIIGCYSRSVHPIEAIKLFGKMIVEGIKPNYVTLLAVIAACATLTSLQHGCIVHCYVLKCGFFFDVFIGNALIHMYSKCGCLVASCQIFREMQIKDEISWSSLINGCGLHGYGEEALRLFHEMQERGIKPDALTLLTVLSACKHAGLVEEGVKIFESAKKEGKIQMTAEHYACHIDLLGKSGKIEDALDIVRAMPVKPSAKVWSSLVSACKIHGRWEMAEMLAHQLVQSEPENAANYSSLSSIYAESGKWRDVEEVRRGMRAQGLNKSYGFSKI